MKNVDLKPEFLLYVFVGLFLLIGGIIAKDYGISPDEPIEKTRASIALSRYGISLGDIDEDYDNLGHSQFYGTATSMILIWGASTFSSILDVPAEVILHYGYFLTFVIALISLFYLIKIFTNSWTALFTSLLFATQPLLFGHAFMNPKDIPLLAVFLMSVTLGFYVDIDYSNCWDKNIASETDRPSEFQAWKKFLAVLPRTTYRTLLFFPTVIVLVFLLKPILTDLLTLIITTAYTEHQSFWGNILARITTNLFATPLQAYLNKGVMNLARVINIILMLLFLGFFVYGMKLLRIGFRQFPQYFQASSIQSPLSLKLKKPCLILAGVAYGFAISTRIVAIFAGGIVAIYLLWRFRHKAILPLLMYIFFSLLVAYLFWPIFWQYGISAVIKALSLFANFDPYSGSILFMGKIYRASDIPWYFLPKLIFLQFTEPVILLSLSGFLIWCIFLPFKEKWSSQNTKLLLIFLWFTLPFTYVVVTTPIMYNNFRQFIFITPPLFVFAALAIQFLHDWLGHRVVMTLISIFIFLGITNLISLHPYQYVYYNQFTGGVRGAFRNYDLDYFSISVKETMEYVNQVAPQNASILVWEVEFWQASFYKRPDINIKRFVHYMEAENSLYQLAVVPTNLNYDMSVPEDWKAIHTVSRNGADLFVIYEINGE